MTNGPFGKATLNHIGVIATVCANHESNEPLNFVTCCWLAQAVVVMILGRVPTSFKNNSIDNSYINISKPLFSLVFKNV